MSGVYVRLRIPSALRIVSPKRKPTARSVMTIERAMIGQRRRLVNVWHTTLVCRTSEASMVMSRRRVSTTEATLLE